MIKQNKFKIVIASYNNEKWVEYNLASVLNQTYENYHVYYVDDCSTDKTNELVNDIVAGNNKFTVIKNELRVGEEAIYNYIRFFETLNDDDIFVIMCGDDWLFDEHVLDKLNSFYNEKDSWMTYGKFYAYNGLDASEANPQNTPYPDFIHKHKLYRRDTWRASHLLTFRGFLIKAVNLDDIKSRRDGKWYYHAPDLAIAYPCMEMCPKDKIGVVDFPTYVWNATPACQVNTKARETNDNSFDIEVEIRNKKHYKEGLSGEKLLQVNSFGYLECHDIPTKFTYCYNQVEGEFDMTILMDEMILDYLNGKIVLKSNAPVVARLVEERDYFQKRIYNAVLENYSKFAEIWTYDRELLEKIPNTKLMLPVQVNQFNMLPNPYGYQPYKSSLFDSYELPDNAFQLYPKSKLVSTIASAKAFLPGHVKRLEFVRSIQHKVDWFGRGVNELPSKLDGLRDYMFSVAIENHNTITNYGITEKIVDCFLTGTVPIYHGCPHIADFFDKRGILVFNTQEELSNIINNLSKDKYQQMLPFVQSNFLKCFDYPLNNDMIYDMLYKNIIKMGKIKNNLVY